MNINFKDILLSNLYKFLKSPDLIQVKLDRNTFLVAFRQFIFFDIVLLFFWGVMNLIVMSLFDDYAAIISNKGQYNDEILKNILFIILIAPILEELSFRLGLKINNINISLGLAAQSIILLKVLDIIDSPLYLRILYILIVFALIFFIFSKLFTSFIERNFKSFVYWNFLVFAFLHLYNYNFINYSDYFFIPFLILVQLALGIYLSYARLSYGFFFALFVHMFHNSLIILPAILQVIIMDYFKSIG